MRYAIVDNSTLTAVDRLMGRIEVSNLHVIDGDIAALETLVQAILFYDKVFYLDDYKERFRAARRQTFHYLTPIDPGAVHYEKILVASGALTDGLVFEATAGKVDENEFRKFLDMLRMHTTFTWDMQSSSWFLTLKMLQGNDDISVEKYSKLHQMIAGERLANVSTIESEPEVQFKLVDSAGRPITARQSAGALDNAITPHLERFIANLGWLAKRTAFYATFASNFNADAVLHPIRSAFLVHLSRRLLVEKSPFQVVIDLMSGKIESAVREITQISDPFASQMDLPIFSAWLVERTHDPQRIMEEALAVRGEPLFVQARQQLIDIEGFAGSHADSVAAINKLNVELSRTAVALQRTYRAAAPAQMSLAPAISLWNTVFPGAMIPDIGIKVPVPRALAGLAHRKGFQGVLRSITHDLVAVERLGATHQLLCSRVLLGEQARAHDVKTEDRRYFGKASHWKRPM